MRALVAAISLACATLGGCALSVPEDYFGCSMDSDCPPGWFCGGGGRCVSMRDAVDAGRDGSVDASHAPDAWSSVDAAIDVGRDVGQDAGVDASVPTVDSGADAGVDAAVIAPVDGGSDAGNDAGHDAGHDASTWTPNGTYTTDSDISYMCAGHYDFNVGSWTFVDDGTTLQVAADVDILCMLVGPTSRTTGAFDVTCHDLMNGCTATYRWMGSFTSDRAWTANFTVVFTGSCGTLPDTCLNQTYSSVVGSR